MALREPSRGPSAPGGSSDVPVTGAVELALDGDLEQLAAAGAPFSATLAATARALARSLDHDPDRRAATAKELRATLDKLAEGASAGDGGPDLSGLSSPDDGAT